MNTDSPIVAGIDFSAPSAAVLRHAVHAAGLENRPVVALHVLDSSRLSHRFAIGGEPDTTKLTEQALGKLRALAESQTSGAKISFEVRQGRPAEELHRYVEESAAPLLVIAANDLTKKRLGSIAARCVRSAPCDVMVLRDWQEGNFTKIMVCTDFSETSAKALERAVELAETHQAALEIVHVMYPPSLDVWGEVLEHPLDSPTSYAEECRERTRRAMEDFIAPQRDALSKVPHTTVVLESASPSSALTHHTVDSGADLVLLGTRGVSRFAGLLLGTNAERLLHDAPVSVLAVRA